MLCTQQLLTRHHSPRLLVRRASVLSHAHLRRQQLDRTRRSQQLDGVLQQRRQQQRQQQQQQQDILRQTAMLSQPKAYVFRHEGAVPRSPQAVSKLEYVLGELPLGQTGYYMPRVSARVDGAAEARKQAQELESVVKRATAVMGALAAASKQHADEATALVRKTGGDVDAAEAVSGGAGSSWASVSAAAALGASSVLGLLLAVGSPLIQ
ncbi:hypothetical protein LPJ56_004854 [Coemansia sp. RSA 2599]|nr:hypothetical protein LPJ56_004854 [Coemansia sp. RSA 2599]